VDLDHDGRWWAPSGRVFYAAEPSNPREEAEIARAHFFQPRRFVDPFSNATVVTYDRHDLMPVRVRDAVENAQVAEIDYRVASPTSPSAEELHLLWNCPVCGGVMRVVERLSAAQLLLRSPPQPDRCAA